MGEPHDSWGLTDQGSATSIAAGLVQDRRDVTVYMCVIHKNMKRTWNWYNLYLDTTCSIVVWYIILYYIKLYYIISYYIYITFQLIIFISYHIIPIPYRNITSTNIWFMLHKYMFFWSNVHIAAGAQWT